MSRHHATLIRTMFHDRPAHNLHWRDIESLPRHVGATVESISGARVCVTLNRMEEVLPRPTATSSTGSRCCTCTPSSAAPA